MKLKHTSYFNMARTGALLCLFVLKCVVGLRFDNRTDLNALPSVRQLLEFKLEHSKPIGLLTVGSGAPVDIRDQITYNSDLLRSNYFFDRQFHLAGERIPSRIVQAKGTGAWGYFEVTNDVSKYTKADVFNGIGKKTPALARLSVGYPGTGGIDLGRDLKDLSVKLYTKEGILDFLSLQSPFFAFKDPAQFVDFVHAFDKRNPKSNLQDPNMIIDITCLRPSALPTILYLSSDFAVPNGFSHTDFFPIHTYELNNEHDERWYVKFNWRTERGKEYLTSDQILLINDPDYLIRRFYNSIENGTYPIWRLEMDVMSLRDIQIAKFNPFDVTRLWENGTYETVPIGRLVLNRNPENQFSDIEMAAFNPANLVPGIPGPVDALFRGRRIAYRDAQNYRLGRNHLKIGVNSPYYEKSYKRDGHPPVLNNGKDSPTYYPNSFNGPIPVVDDERPVEFLQVFESNAVDLQVAADFYYRMLPDDSARQRLANTLAALLSLTVEHLQERFIKLLSLAAPDLAVRVATSLQEAKLIANTAIPVLRK